MASSSKNLPPPKTVEAEERKGLLSQDDDPYDHDSFEEDDDTRQQTRTRAWSRTRIASVAIALIGLLVTGTFARTVLFAKSSRPPAPYSETALHSNGTHEFKRTVLIVSIDGLRYFSAFLCIQ